MASEPPPLPESGHARPTPPPVPLTTAPAWPPDQAATARPGFTQRLILEGRLHPLTLLFAAWAAIRGVLIPVLFIWFFGRKGAFEFYIWLGLLFVGLPVALAVVRYFTFTYRIEAGELITRHGLLGRTERHIPLTRVQDIRVEQRPLHRVFGVAEVNVETAGGQGAEASLSVLSRAEADRLRAAVFEQIQTGVGADAASRTPAAEAPAREIVRRLSWRDLVLAGLTSNQMASVLALIFLGWGFLDDVLPQETYERVILRGSEAAAQWIEQAGQSAWLVLALGAALVMVVGILFSIVGAIVMFHGFTLSRSGEDLHRTYGLLTRRASSLPRRRIQVLKIEETLLRRAFRLATLRADTAGSRGNPQEGSGGRDMLLPIVGRGEVEGMLPTFFPDLEPGAGEWRQVSRRAIWRGTFKGAVACALLAAASFAIQQEWLGLWPLLFIPAVYGLNVMSYRYLGYWLGGRYFRTRRGWLRRATHIVPIRNTQTVLVRETPFDRRHGVATLLMDTAGQAYTGGGPRIGNVPRDEALALARTLAQRAAETRYRW